MRICPRIAVVAWAVGTSALVSLGVAAASAKGFEPGLPFAITGEGSEVPGYKLVLGDEHACPTLLQIIEGKAVSSRSIISDLALEMDQMGSAIFGPPSPSTDEEPKAHGATENVSGTKTSQKNTLAKQPATKGKELTVHSISTPAGGEGRPDGAAGHSFEYSRPGVRSVSRRFGVPSNAGVDKCGTMSLVPADKVLRHTRKTGYVTPESVIVGRLKFETQQCVAKGEKAEVTATASRLPTHGLMAILNMTGLSTLPRQIPFPGKHNDSSISIEPFRRLQAPDGSTTKVMVFVRSADPKEEMQLCAYMDGNRVVMETAKSPQEMLFPNATASTSPRPTLDTFLGALLNGPQNSTSAMSSAKSGPGHFGSAGTMSALQSSPQASSNATTNSSPLKTASDASCFPAAALVELEDGSRRQMDALSPGDRVKVGPALYSPILTFTHRARSATRAYVRLETGRSGTALTATAGHYVYANGALVPAGRVMVGDELELGDGGRARVTAVRSVLDSGLYNPQTMHGDIVVDGVVASTYTTAVRPTVAHSAMVVLRGVYEWVGWSSLGLEHGASCLARWLPDGPRLVE